jgi:hypothetical protein
MKRLLCFSFILFSIVATCQQSSDLFNNKLAIAGESIENSAIIYDGSYYSIDYPNGDVSSSIGVCTDVIIRAYRVLGIDLQKELHEDVIANREAYVRIKKPDKNIDHRRVPNLATFFKLHGEILPITDNASDYRPGDIIWWNLSSDGVLNHIGLVVTEKSKDGKRHLVIHNIGGGQNIDDFLFGAQIVGHYAFSK